VIWNDRDRLLIRAADELVTGYDLSDELWRLLSEHWRPDLLLEIVITVGWYRAVSLVINVSRVELENWQDRFPRRR
jgi:hypothetical protein